MPNPLGKVIPRSSGRKLAVGDIHGCIKSFEALLKQIDLTTEDQLFLLGDYVNKGPESEKVLDLIIELKENYQVFPLLGNHDLKVLEYLNGSKPELWEDLIEENSQVFIELEEKEKSKYIDFLESLHYYFILDEYLLAHAGFNFSLANPFISKEDIINIKEFFYDSSKAQNKTVIHGHAPQELSLIERKIAERSKIIPLDNGCVYPDRSGQGNLLCLNLDSAKLFVQPYID